MRAYGHKEGQWVAGKLFCSTTWPATLAWPVGVSCKHSNMHSMVSCPVPMLSPD